jgi:hypothetical protein
MKNFADFVPLASFGCAALLAGCLAATSPISPDGATGTDASAGPDSGGSDSGNSGPDGGSCGTACDCTPGLACSGGQCVVGFTEVYCCTSSECPGGSICQYPSGNYSVCSVDGGSIPPDAGACATACDCSPGLSCINGQCLATPQPEYCCTSNDCPKGFGCQNPDGTYSQCGGTAPGDAGITCVCESFFQCCGSECVNFDNDPFNCGGCGNVCGGATPYCAGGKCQTPPCLTPDAGTCAASAGLCCGVTCCGQGQLCCELDGPVIGAFCYMPTPQQPTCPRGCPVCN